MTAIRKTHWDMLHDCVDAIQLHGKVVDMDGVRVAGLGGHLAATDLVASGAASFCRQGVGHGSCPRH